jgi:hypothetical protein
MSNIEYSQLAAPDKYVEDKFLSLRNTILVEPPISETMKYWKRLDANNLESFFTFPVIKCILRRIYNILLANGSTH